VRVRELLKPSELRELVESRDINRRLQLLEGRAELLQIVSRHLQPGVSNKVGNAFERVYQRVINTPNAVGDFFRRGGDRLEQMGPTRSVAFVNQLKKLALLGLEFPAMLENFLPMANLPFMPRFAPKFREKRTQIEVEERIYMAINAEKKKGRPFIEFQGFDPEVFVELKQKHMPKDAQGNVTSEEFTEAVRTAILRDTVQSSSLLIRNLTEAEHGGDPDLGKTEQKKIVVAMRDLIHPNLIVENRVEEETNALKLRITGTPAQPSVWGAAGTIKAVEFGTAYSFARADGKLTVPRDSVNENGDPVTDQGRTLQTVLTEFPSTVKSVTVVGAGENLVLGDDVSLPLNRPETPAQIADFIAQVQAHPRVSILRSTNNQTMLGHFRYIGEGGRGVLEWNNNLALVEDVKSFLGTPALLSDARPLDEWKPAAGGGWEKIART